MINRREFLRNTAVGAAALAAGASAMNDLLASPYGMPVGIALYTVHDEMAKDPRGTIKKLAEIGYKEVEIVHFNFGRPGSSSTGQPSDIFGTPTKDFASLLSENGMRAFSGHYLLNDIKGDWDLCIEQAHTLGLEYMTHAGFMPKDIPLSLDSWKRIIDIFNEAAEPVHKAGMTFNYHNHNFEFRRLDGTLVYDYLTQNLDPRIHFTLDCFWAVHAGYDPVALIKARPGRVPLLHIKDMPKGLAPSCDMSLPYVKGFEVEVGRGVIDWKRIFAAAPIGGMRHFYYEQDICDRPALESAKISFEYLNKLTV